MKDKSIEVGGGFWSLLTVAFVVLKLTDVIDWRWWIVSLPIVVGLVINVSLFLIIVYLATRED